MEVISTVGLVKTIKEDMSIQKTLEALRIKEEAIEKDKSDGIKAEARYVTLDDLYELWKDLKRGLKKQHF